jgi:2-haloalkanoic acid dehalogenase type II
MRLNPLITMIAFDMYSTLVQNHRSDWEGPFMEIAAKQRLGIAGQDLYREWTRHEMQFRRTRTNPSDFSANPPFKTYYSAWVEAFQQTFKSLGLIGDPHLAASQCIDSLGTRVAFPDASRTLEQIASAFQLAVLSNADDDFLLPVIKFNGWAVDSNPWQFQTVLSSESAQAYKPDPKIFIAFCKRASLEPNQVLFVGDAPYDDAHGAKMVGMQTVLIQREDNPGRTPPPNGVNLAKPDFKIDSLGELLGILFPESD